MSKKCPNCGGRLIPDIHTDLMVCSTLGCHYAEQMKHRQLEIVGGHVLSLKRLGDY